MDILCLPFDCGSPATGVSAVREVVEREAFGIPRESRTVVLDLAGATLVFS